MIRRITVDDVVDVIRDEGDRGIMGQAGSSEEENMFSPVCDFEERGIWLGINLLTAFLAAWVIGFFESYSTRWWRWRFSITIVPSMGGIAGSPDADHRHPRPGTRSARHLEVPRADQKKSPGFAVEWPLWASSSPASILWFGNFISA